MNDQDAKTDKTVRESMRTWLRVKTSRVLVKGKKPWYLEDSIKPRRRPFSLYLYGMKDHLSLLSAFYALLKLPFIVVQSAIEELRAGRAERQRNRDKNG